MYGNLGKEKIVYAAELEIITCRKDSKIATLGTANIAGTGFVDLKNTFDNAKEEILLIPVYANVKSNNAYKIVFSNGSNVDVTCVQDGVLNVPVSKIASGLTYIIYGTATDPATAMMAAQSITGLTAGDAAMNTGIFGTGTLATAGLAS